MNKLMWGFVIFIWIVTIAIIAGCCAKRIAASETPPYRVPRSPEWVEQLPPGNMFEQIREFERCRDEHGGDPTPCYR